MRGLDRPMEIVIYLRSSCAEHPWEFNTQETAIRKHLDRLGIPHDRARVIRDATSRTMRRRPGLGDTCGQADDEVFRHEAGEGR